MCSMDYGKKKIFKLVWRYQQVMSRFLANGPLPQMSRQSRLSTNDKGDNEMISGVVHKFSGIYLTAEETPENLS